MGVLRMGYCEEGDKADLERTYRLASVGQFQSRQQVHRVYLWG